jgi:gluconate kinase
MDESGHDHNNMPYEVRGGIAVHAGRLWPLVRSIQALEVECFGAELHAFKKEFKGCNLLDKDRFKWANQMPWMAEEERRKNALAFLNRSAAKDNFSGSISPVMAKPASQWLEESFSYSSITTRCSSPRLYRAA